MVLNGFKGLALPPTVRVPSGALRQRYGNGKSEEQHRSLLMRSGCVIGLSQQVAEWKEIGDIVEAELFNTALPDEDLLYLPACFVDGLLERGKHDKHMDEHPANIIGKLAAGEFILTRRGAELKQVLGVFLAAQQRTFFALRSSFGETVHVPGIFDRFDFMEPSSLPAQVKAAHDWLGRTRDYICSSLNVIRLTVKAKTDWSIAVVPNIVGASDADVISQVGIFYELYAARDLHGVSMTADDVRNWKAILPPGSGTRGLLDFLIVKFASSEMRTTLQYTPSRCKSIISRGDQLMQGLRTERTNASLTVAGKVIKASSQAVKDARAASDYEMRRLVKKEKVCYDGLGWGWGGAGLGWGGVGLGCYCCFAHCSSCSLCNS